MTDSNQPTIDPVLSETNSHTSLDQNKDQQIAAILVVGFHHAFGPIVEFCVPPLPYHEQGKTQQTLEKLELPEEWSFLPFLALPDGAHQKDEDFAYFHLPPVPGWSVAETTLFGISCNRQIASKDLLVKTPDITRSIVQKAVVVLARQPIFGPLRQKLAVITAAWFNQRDFTKLDILHNLYNNLNGTFHGPIDDSTLYMGTSLRELVYKFKSKTLMLLKLLLLEKRVLFYGYPVETLCTFQYSLISLIPGLLRNLQDSGAPELDTSDENITTTEAKVLADGSKESLLKYMGLPLHIFEKGSFFQPYLPLQQIEMLSSEQTKSYVVGTTNQIFFHHKSDAQIDVLVNLDNGALEFYNQQLVSLVNPTIADRRWMENIVKVVNDTWNQNGNPSRPLQNTYLGSDDYLRARFEEYILSLLSSVKHAQAHNLLDNVYDTMDNGASNIEEVMTDENEERNYLSDYGMKWLMAWGETNNFKKWNQYTDHEIYEIVEPGHPGMGNISMADIQNTLSNRLRDLQLKQNLAPIRNTLSRAMSGGAKAMFSGRSKLNAMWTEFERGANEEGHTKSSPKSASRGSFQSEKSASLASPQQPLADNSSSSVESTSQQAGRLFSNFSSFLSRKTKEFSQVMEESVSENSSPSHSRRASTLKQQSVTSSLPVPHTDTLLSDDDDAGSAAFVDVGQMYPFTTAKSHAKKNEEDKILDV
ncbi:cytoplasm protein [Mucor ambiguus]|uniref:Cytoplasm protein n=1 Tax=Mucor ambiguus TaxID=91626 RepID=A0A0C9M4K8_9FUNG|nr:cytoplasm protein [Mucor ambiguus]